MLTGESQKCRGRHQGDRELTAGHREHTHLVLLGSVLASVLEDDLGASRVLLFVSSWGVDYSCLPPALRRRRHVMKQRKATHVNKVGHIVDVACTSANCREIVAGDPEGASRLPSSPLTAPPLTVNDDPDSLVLSANHRWGQKLTFSGELCFATSLASTVLVILERGWLKVGEG